MHDSEQPRLEAGVIAQHCELLVRLDECVLRNVLGRERIQNDRQRASERRPSMAAYQ